MAGICSFVFVIAILIGYLGIKEKLKKARDQSSVKSSSWTGGAFLPLGSTVVCTDVARTLTLRSLSVYVSQASERLPIPPTRRRSQRRRRSTSGLIRASLVGRCRSLEGRWSWTTDDKRVSLPSSRFCSRDRADF